MRPNRICAGPRSRRPILTGLILVGLIAAAPASAREVVVQVDAKSGPWLPGANRKMPFGRDAAAPLVVPGIPDMSGKVSIYPEGTTISAGNGAVDAKGVESKAVDDSKGPGGKPYPSLYTPKILYPANLHALVAVFTDDKGVLVGRPFIVGEGARVSIPEGARALSFGFNDVDFAGNSGSLKVTIEMPDD
ncbi:MAG: hypothetical protein V4564_24585 [Pseudomonadota bacterium]